MRNLSRSSIAGLVIALSLSILTQAPARAEKKGPGSTGGGNAVMTESGQLRFIDSLSQDEVESIKTNAWTAVESIQKSAPFQLSIHSFRDPDFFACAKNEITDSKLFSDDQKALWLKALNTVVVNRMSVPNFDVFKDESDRTTIASAIFLMRGELPILPFAYSSKTSVFNQIPIASYRQLGIDIYNDFYSRLPESDQCDTQVHESIRVYGDTVGSQLFNTNEVEALTKAMRGHLITDDRSYQSALKKIKL